MFQVLLTSLKTGGVGLNLTAASNVFIMVAFYLCIYHLHVLGKINPFLPADIKNIVFTLF